MTAGAVLLDVDGTLVDTNYLHVVAWYEAFLDRGHVVTCTDIHHAIGRGSHDLVETLLGHPDDDVVEGHSRRWSDLRGRMRPLPGARELVRALHDRGLRVVWATSGDEDDLQAFRRVLDVDDAVHDVVSSSDVERSKPSPDVVELALDAAGVPADRAVMVGDSVFDIRAARRAGVPCVAVLGGGVGEADLRREEPAAVYAGCDAVLADLAAGPIAQLL